MQKEHSATGCAAGCKIKQLRTRTNTYIKTPVRGEEPKFVITGRKEDVDEAKKTILAMGDELTRVRERRAMMQAAQRRGLLEPVSCCTCREGNTVRCAGHEGYEYDAYEEYE